MKDKISKVTLMIIMCITTAFSLIIAAISFVPTTIWGLCNGVSLINCFYYYWVDGVWNTLHDAFDSAFNYE